MGLARLFNCDQDSNANKRRRIIAEDDAGNYNHLRASSKLEGMPPKLAGSQGQFSGNDQKSIFIAINEYNREEEEEEEGRSSISDVDFIKLQTTKPRLRTKQALMEGDEAAMNVPNSSFQSNFNGDYSSVEGLHSTLSSDKASGSSSHPHQRYVHSSGRLTLEEGKAFITTSNSERPCLGIGDPPLIRNSRIIFLHFCLSKPQINNLNRGISITTVMGIKIFA